ncbi:MAG: hypothetical protein K9H26_19635 [Prolixibacteraceae bacterium]|nr:hypothetical protein [Prolixibacteraceae bacterium]
MKKKVFFSLLGAFVMLNVTLSVTTTLDNNHFNLKNAYAWPANMGEHSDPVTVKPGEEDQDCTYTVWVCDGNDDCWPEEFDGTRRGCTEQGNGCSPTSCS